jgi:L-threonylcarbamoyladenylate synthase
MIRSATPATFQLAAGLLRQHQVVAFPTETVYGLGANATSSEAVANIYACKSRPQFNPLIIHVRDIAQAETLGCFTKAAYALAETFWPGPLTLVLNKQKDCPIDPLALAGMDTIAVRVPHHPVAQMLLEAVDFPLAAPSANRSGSLSPTTADHVQKSLGDAVPLIIDGGTCDVGLESTILDCTSDRLAILRQGAVTQEDIETILGYPIGQSTDHTIKAPGQLKSHYAPTLPLRLNADHTMPGEAWLGFGDKPQCTLNLSPTQDLKEASRNLFVMLHLLDTPTYTGIAVSPIPHQGLGMAINDRLERAAADRT